MSLINKMLRDLEDREAFVATPQDGVIGDLRSAQDFAHLTARRRYRSNILFGGLLLSAVSLFALNQYHQYSSIPVTPAINAGQAPRSGKAAQGSRHHARSISKRSVASPLATANDIQNPMLALKLDAKPLQVPSKTVADSAPVARSVPALLGIQQQADNSGGRIDLRFSSPPQYSLYLLENPERLLVVLPGASIPPDRLSDFKPTGMISGVRYARESGVNKVIFDMTGPVVMKSADVDAGPGGVYNFHIRYTAVNSGTATDTVPSSDTSITAATPDMNSKASELPDTTTTTTASPDTSSPAARAAAGRVINAAVTPAPISAPEPAANSAAPPDDDDAAAMVNVKQQSSEDVHAQRLYKEGVSDFYRGKYARAISALQEVLRISPTYLEARQLLVSILMDQGDRKDAAHLLEQGLEYHPDDPTLIKMNARMLYQDGELQQAMQMLAQIKPQLQDDPEYYALMAAILQKDRNYTRAGEIYQKLVNLNPGNGVWWAGLGISLDGIGRGAQALQAFKKAAADPSIPAGLREYLSTRIKALAKAPA